MRLQVHYYPKTQVIHVFEVKKGQPIFHRMLEPIEGPDGQPHANFVMASLIADDLWEFQPWLWRLKRWWVASFHVKRIHKDDATVLCVRSPGCRWYANLRSLRQDQLRLVPSRVLECGTPPYLHVHESDDLDTLMRKFRVLYRAEGIMLGCERYLKALTDLPDDKQVCVVLGL